MKTEKRPTAVHLVTLNAMKIDDRNDVRSLDRSKVARLLERVRSVIGREYDIDIKDRVVDD